MLSQRAHRADLLLWPAQRCHGSVQSRCRAATICRAANIAPELVQLERSCLADLSTEELELQLKKHGISIQTKPRTKQQIPPQHADTERTRPAATQRDHHQFEQKQHHSQQDRPKHPQHPQQQQQQQRPPHPQGAEARSQQQARSRSRRVAAAAARRALLLEQLANARVQARSRIVRLPLRLSIAGRAKSRRYLTVPVDVEGAGFVDFLIDSSGYLSRITPAVRDKLCISPADGVAIVTGSSGSSSGGGRGASGSSSGGGRGGSGSSSGTSSSGGRAHVRLRQRVKLPKMWLGTAQLPPQQAYVTPLQLPPRHQQQLWPGSGGAGGSSMQRVLAAAGTVGGVLGVQVLREFEVDIDFGGNSVALHPAGHVDLGLCDTRGLVEVPLRLTKTGALVVPVSLAGSPPFTGLLDLSAASSMLNWEAAALLGMHCNLDSDDEEGEEQQDTGVDDDSSSSSSSSSHAGSGADSSVRSQQQRQQQRRRARQRSAIKHVGKFGSLDVMPADEMLQKPSLPRHSSSSSGSDGLQSQVAPLRRAPRKQPPRSSSSSSSSSSLSAAGYSYTPLPGSSIVQQHQVASNAVRLVLGSSKSGANPTTTNSSTSSTSSSSTSTSSSASSSMPASLALAPPNRFSVAGLKAVSHLGLSGQPVMIVGWDVWARQRAVLCLKVGKLFLSAAAS